MPFTAAALRLVGPQGSNKRPLSASSLEGYFYLYDV